VGLVRVVCVCVAAATRKEGEMRVKEKEKVGEIIEKREKEVSFSSFKT
jgi:hypothetical protein